MKSLLLAAALVSVSLDASAACPATSKLKGSYAGAGQRFNSKGAEGIRVSAELAVLNFDGLGTATRRGRVTGTFISKDHDSFLGQIVQVPSGSFQLFYTYNPVICQGRIDTGTNDSGTTVLMFSLTDAGNQLVGVKFEDDQTSNNENLDAESFVLRKQ